MVYHYLFIYHYVPLIMNQFYVIIINDTYINILLYLKEMSWYVNDMSMIFPCFLGS